MSDTKSKQQCDESPYGNYLGVGFAIGIPVGVALGAAMDNIGAGIAIGVALGPAFALSFKAGAKKRRDEDGTKGTKAPNR